MKMSTPTLLWSYCSNVLKWNAGKVYCNYNKPFLSSLVPLFQNESVQNLSNESKFDLHENEPVGKTHFRNNGFARFDTGSRQIGNSLFFIKLIRIIIR